MKSRNMDFVEREEIQMKKFATTLIGFLAVMGIITFGATVLTKNSSGELAGIIDRFNPIVPKGEVFVKTTKPESVNGYGTAAYKQIAADADGHTRTVEFNGMSELKVDHYLKLTNKGAYVENYEEVAKDEVPPKALSKIQ